MFLRRVPKHLRESSQETCIVSPITVFIDDTAICWVLSVHDVIVDVICGWWQAWVLLQQQLLNRSSQLITRLGLEQLKFWLSLWGFGLLLAFCLYEPSLRLLRWCWCFSRLLASHFCGGNFNSSLTSIASSSCSAFAFAFLVHIIDDGDSFNLL